MKTLLCLVAVIAAALWAWPYIQKDPTGSFLVSGLVLAILIPLVLLLAWAARK